MLELTGKDAIIVHRLLKNSVKAKEYVLQTADALGHPEVPEEKVEPSSEDYEELGNIETFVYYPPPAEPYVPGSSPKFPQIFVDTLRYEVANEYAKVASNPEKRFHFHTGRRLADILGYPEDLLEGLTSGSSNFRRDRQRFQPGENKCWRESGGCGNWCWIEQPDRSTPGRSTREGDRS